MFMFILTICRCCANQTTVIIHEDGQYWGIMARGEISKIEDVSGRK